jgi:hypothetical protein
LPQWKAAGSRLAFGDDFTNFFGSVVFARLSQPDFFPPVALSRAARKAQQKARSAFAGGAFRSVWRQGCGRGNGAPWVFILAGAGGSLSGAFFSEPGKK